MKKKNEKTEKKAKTKNKDESAELRRQIEVLQQEKNELFAKLQRVSADYSNFQKRVPKQVADSIAYEKEIVIKSLLPALDNLEHTLVNSGNTENIGDVIKGVEIIYEQMLDILKSHGVEQIKALGKQFDPALHEAMMQRSEQQSQEGVVLEEYQKGYKLNGRVIRPNKVVVNKLPCEAEENAGREEKSRDEPTEDDAEQMETE